MKKLFTLIAALVCAVCVNAAKEVDIDLSQNYYEQLNKQHALLELYKQSLFFNYNYSMNSYNNNIM